MWKKIKEKSERFKEVSIHPGHPQITEVPSSALPSVLVRQVSHHCTFHT